MKKIVKFWVDDPLNLSQWESKTIYLKIPAYFEVSYTISVCWYSLIKQLLNPLSILQKKIFENAVDDFFFQVKYWTDLEMTWGR